MPERIATAEIKQVDTESIEMDDTYPGTYGFSVSLTRDPGPEWGLEFESAYEGAPYPGKPPVRFQGDHLCVYYLPRYAGDLPRYLRFLRRVVADANRSVEQRNAVLPDEERQKTEFLSRLREAAREAFG
jgi:hypothetical protein